MPFTIPNASGAREGILEFRSLLADF
jgi:hypothetical protein